MRHRERRDQVTAEQVDIEEALHRVPLFAELKPKQIKSLARWTTTREYEPGQTIVRQGQSGMGLYCIQEGRVKVTQHTARGERELREMGPGECFGEISLLDDRPRSATVTAVNSVRAVLLDKGQFLAELHTYPEVALGILPALVTWLREADAKIAELT